MYTTTKITTINTANPTSRNDLLVIVEAKADAASSAT